MSTTKEEIANVLEAAADLYESGQMTWIKGDALREKGAGCVMQAMARVTKDGNNIYWTCEDPSTITRPSARFLDARKALAETIKPGGYSLYLEPQVVYLHNDHGLKSQAEAVDLLKHTAKDLRNQEVA